MKIKLSQAIIILFSITIVIAILCYGYARGEKQNILYDNIDTKISDYFVAITYLNTSFNPTGEPYTFILENMTLSMVKNHIDVMLDNFALNGYTKNLFNIYYEEV